jgi:selenocysteine lyase/cysteine desulfurase
MEESYRSFGVVDELESEDPLLAKNTQSIEMNQQYLERLRNDIVGGKSTFQGPYGQRPIIYCDWTASGRCLQSIELYLQKEVLPLYGNTHTTTSITGHQSTCFRDEARKIVAESVNAKITGRASEDLVLFTGNGTTGAIRKLILALGLHTPLPPSSDDNLDRPVIFVSYYEHHSNLLSWRETVADVISIKYSPETGVCLKDLEDKLDQFKLRRLKIGSFSAASNVTGILTDVVRVSIRMHKAGGLVFFDYATAAPYVKIDMNPALVGEDSIYAYKDAIFFSGHKFLGGPGSPGVLIVKSKVMPSRDSMPTEPGGGTVFYVTNDHHRYLSNKTEREEAGTPNLLGDVKLGLAMHVQSTIGISWIEREELHISHLIQSKLEKLERLVVLGRCGNIGKHLPIFAFLVRFGDRFLHYNFVCALLNDLFGIQARGGCSCAGPLSQDILGISHEANKDIELALLDKHEVLRPGYTRVSFPYWIGMAEIEYVVDAIEFVATHGWCFLPQYKYNPKTGEWAHVTRMTKFPERIWLSHFSLTEATPKTIEASSVTAINFMAVMSNAHNELSKAKVSKELNYRLQQEHRSIDASDLNERLRWFILLSDVNVSTSQSLLPLHCPLNPIGEGSLLHSGESGASSESQTQGTAYALERSRLKLVSRSAMLREEMQPRYMNPQQSWSSGVPLITTLPLKISIEPRPIQSPVKPDNEDAPSSPVLSSSLVPRGALCETRSRPADGKLLPGQGIEFRSDDLKLTSKPVDPPKKIMKLVGQAIKDWDMIQDGDRLLLGLSGGKDSLALLHILLALQKRAPIRFEIACCTVDPQTPSFDPSSLIPYVQSLGITYHYMSEPIIEIAKSKMQGDSLCAFCARFKRGLLYSTCRTHGYNKLVLAQHLDDLAESFYMYSHNLIVFTSLSNLPNIIIIGH